MFRVVDVSLFESIRPEVLGSKSKEWLMLNRMDGFSDLPYLFKEGRPNTGENWAEKVTSEIAHGLEIPCARYDLAIRNGSKGVICEQIMPLGASLALGNLLILQLVPDYEYSKLRHQKDYRLSTVFEVVQQIEELKAPPSSMLSLTKPIDFFVGYLLFDVLIGNTDRHHENWGVVVERANGISGQVETWLAPTFDHASSLGREESDEKRQKRLTTKDNRANLSAYAGKAKTAFYADGEPPRMLKSFELLRAIKTLEPDAFRFWGEKICALEKPFFEDIFNRIPSDWISDIATKFAVAVLIMNQHFIREAIDG